jgi:MFS family permease
MVEYQQSMSDSWSQRMRLIRFRRKRENFSFWREFKIIPRWIIWTLGFLFLGAQCSALAFNMVAYRTGGVVFPPDIHNTALACLAMAGIITGVALCIASYVLLVAYVNRDAKRRGMSSGLWTLLVVVLSPAYLAIGFIMYFLMREPLPYNCPQCGATVGARFNYCPNCKCNLHPACPQCKREVVETDRYCPYCAQELATTTLSEAAIERPT